MAEAVQAWAQFADNQEIVATMNDLFDRYMMEVAPLKAKETYRSNLKQMPKLRAAFGHIPPEAITPVHIYRYLDVRGKTAPVSANRDKALLSHVFTMAIRWGAAQNNPCRNVKRLPEKRRDRYITDKEFLAVKKLASPLIACVMDFAYLTGQRLSDILKVKLADIGDDGISIEIGKTKNKILIEWSDALCAVIAESKRIRGRVTGLYLFCNRKGRPYTRDGFSSLWQRLMKEVVAEGVLTERFRFHDIRRKSATDLEKASGREQARRLLGHGSQQMTGVYISGKQSVKPVK